MFSRFQRFYNSIKLAADVLTLALAFVAAYFTRFTVLPAESLPPIEETLEALHDCVMACGGFKAVGKGQVEAAQTLGLSPWRTFTLIRLPLALRAMLPILANQYVWLIKATTMGIVVGFTDFFMITALTINHSGQTLEAIFILMAGFLTINLSIAAIFNRINKAIALKGNQLRG